MVLCYCARMGTGPYHTPFLDRTRVSTRALFAFVEVAMEHGPRFARDFYRSFAWRRCRDGYAAYVQGLCERCLKRGLIVPGEEVHHKIRLTPENINNPAVALNWENLEMLCKQCHLDEHRPQRWRADPDGHVEL